MTWLGRPVAMASFMIGIDEVFEARTASGASTTLSSASKTATFSASDSTTASTTSWRSASDPRSAEYSMLARAASASDSLSLAAFCARPMESAMRWRPRSRLAWSRSTTRTSKPARAAASVMPDPMRPQPTTPTLSISIASLLQSAGPGAAARDELSILLSLLANTWNPPSAGSPHSGRRGVRARFGGLDGPLSASKGRSR